jgi:hypothetical protein
MWMNEECRQTSAGYAVLTTSRVLREWHEVNPSCDLLTSMEDFRPSAGSYPPTHARGGSPWTTTSSSPKTIALFLKRSA